jgi:hypothetical protein
LFAEVISMIRFAGAMSALVGAAILAAPSAAADQVEYLNKLQDKYAFLTPQQLLDEGNRVCVAESGGSLSPDRTTMVRNDLNVAVGVALEIVSTAEWDLC